ncbi:unnamed protein product, partial [marine sediment metagenome]
TSIAPVSPDLTLPTDLYVDGELYTPIYPRDFGTKADDE